MGRRREEWRPTTWSKKQLKSANVDQVIGKTRLTQASTLDIATAAKQATFRDRGGAWMVDEVTAMRFWARNRSDA